MADGRSEGVSLGGLLFVVFLVLKLTDNIDWSWWWVASPLWIPVGLLGVILVISGVIAVLVGTGTRVAKMSVKDNDD